jgi:hypothetical protein
MSVSLVTERRMEMRAHRAAIPLLAIVSMLALAGGPSPASAQRGYDPGAAVAAQRKAMERLAMLDGVWRGSAWMMLPNGEKHHLIQTERVGPFLSGSIKMIEGRGYEEDGSVGFNALGIISFDQGSDALTFRTYAQGRVGDYPLTLTADGFQWEIPAGPMTIRYAATIKDGTWEEVGDRIVPGQDPIRFFEMTLARIGDTNWPDGGAVPSK